MLIVLGMASCMDRNFAGDGKKNSDHHGVSTVRVDDAGLGVAKAPVVTLLRAQPTVQLNALTPGHNWSQFSSRKIDRRIGH